MPPNADALHCQTLGVLVYICLGLFTAKFIPIPIGQPANTHDDHVIGFFLRYFGDFDTLLLRGERLYDVAEVLTQMTAAARKRSITADVRPEDEAAKLAATCAFGALAFDEARGAASHLALVMYRVVSAEYRNHLWVRISWLRAQLGDTTIGQRALAHVDDRLPSSNVAVHADEYMASVISNQANQSVQRNLASATRTIAKYEKIIANQDGKMKESRREWGRKAGRNQEIVARLQARILELQEDKAELSAQLMRQDRRGRGPGE
jgi:hypothetical protein